MGLSVLNLMLVGESVDDDSNLDRVNQSDRLLDNSSTECSLPQNLKMTM
ncbi:MAG: hypothetical protein KME16_17035 [Scytolyngbya sp. HA4215-MV1]|jgi:hypothetical protein|nr:hypothetical protein [Scytolyngbya sp. HA4215-MV1]